MRIKNLKLKIKRIFHGENLTFLCDPSIPALSIFPSTPQSVQNINLKHRILLHEDTLKLLETSQMM